MCVEALYNIFPKGLKFLCDILTDVLLIIFGVVMLVFGIQYSIKTSGNFQTSLGYSMCVFYVPCAVAGLQITVYAFCNMVMSIMSKATGRDIHFE